MSGILHGVGVGPGDPGLITRLAAQLIENASIIAYPSLAGGDSFARSIAADLIPSGVTEIRIDIPMTRAREPAQAAYDEGAARIARALETGQDVVCLCEGDPFFYGSFMYLHARLKDRFEVKITPGVTSLTACAAAAGTPLTARDEILTILPGPLPDEALRTHLRNADTVALMKVGRHLPRLRALLDEEGLSGTYVERATLAAERILPLAEATDDAPYFSMILVTKGADPWL